ncbi:MAG: hypothetical protein ACREDE_04385 [Thermoplasmata archaeon]
MTLSTTLLEIWRQTLLEGREVVTWEGRSLRVTRTRSRELRGVVFEYDGRRFDGIEQNPETKSRWAALAREGKRIMQFRYQGRYIGNVCDGVLLRYPRWEGAGLGE